MNTYPHVGLRFYRSSQAMHIRIFLVVDIHPGGRPHSPTIIEARGHSSLFYTGTHRTEYAVESVPGVHCGVGRMCV